MVSSKIAKKSMNLWKKKSKKFCINFQKSLIDALCIKVLMQLTTTAPNTQNVETINSHQHFRNDHNLCDKFEEEKTHKYFTSVITWQIPQQAWYVCR